MSLIDNNKINNSLKNLGKWKHENNTISRTFKFSTYMDGINYVHSLALLAERENHHPDIAIRWCSVKIVFTSHDLGGVTEKCIKMATLSNNIFKG